MNWRPLEAYEHLLNKASEAEIHTFCAWPATKRLICECLDRHPLQKVKPAASAGASSEDGLRGGLRS